MKRFQIPNFKSNLVCALILNVTAVIGCASISSHTNHQSIINQTTVANVDLDKYQGKWYEVARLPMYFQRNCASDVTATYSTQTDGSISVLNECTDKGGKPMIANGRAEVDKAYPHANNSKLLVTFMPNWLQWLPVGKAGYWILALDADEQGNYTSSLVGTPSKKYLWMLSRTSKMDNDTYQKYVEIAQSQGYDTSKLMLTKQDRN